MAGALMKSYHYKVIYHHNLVRVDKLAHFLTWGQLHCLGWCGRGYSCYFFYITWWHAAILPLVLASQPFNCALK